MASKANNRPSGCYNDIFNSFLFKYVPASAVCLDVGCWTGNLGAALIRQKRCVVDGIDYKADVLKMARQQGYRSTYKVDLNNDRYNLSIIKGKYDAIICGDVLEHLISPQLLLDKLTLFLKPNGIFIISVPNIAFILYRVKLLLGYWDYESSGVMDKTHLRFFTLKTLRSILRDSGLTVNQCLPYNLVREKFWFLHLLGKFFPSLFSLQFLVIAHKARRTS
ncbi:MAG: Methyltransferase type 11 [Microgenomates group bacterium GW2011_GWA2_44_7]|nr:MAG: Methyltransferase type 11 [Microgenomates group bacterium GW2011_GWA2_44_7]KKT78382.1 MAG: Methyltransferase type 11 [Microgenomates group bacterium GW2011_GWB1_44_8]